MMTALTHSNVETIVITKCGVTDETARMIAERLKEPNSYKELKLISLGRLGKEREGKGREGGRG